MDVHGKVRICSRPEFPVRRFPSPANSWGADDDRDMFPSALKLITEIHPRAVLLENVPGFASAKFADYRKSLLASLEKLGYEADWRILEAADFGVAQLRPRFLLVAMRPEYMRHFFWPEAINAKKTVGETLLDLMAANGWKGAKAWAKKASEVAPTVVGGSKKHGGPDLGPTRAKVCWRNLHVDGKGIAAEAPDNNTPLDFMPRLTVRMVARIQSFPDTWNFYGKKTASYRQVGNAFPPLVAKAIGDSVRDALTKKPYPIAKPNSLVQLRLLENSNNVKVAKQKKKRRM